jgi:hypothetical protein
VRAFKEGRPSPDLKTQEDVAMDLKASELGFTVSSRPSVRDFNPHSFAEIMQMIAD